MPSEKGKTALKRFLTFNPEQDWDNGEIKDQIADIFKTLITSDDPAMKDVVSAMFNSFNKYNSDEDVVGDEEGDDVEEVPEETPSEEPAPEEEPTDEETPPEDDTEEEDTADLFADSFLSNKSVLEDINYWLE